MRPSGSDTGVQAVLVSVSDPEGLTPRRISPTLRLGLRQIDGITEADARRIVEVRAGVKVSDPPGLTPSLDPGGLQAVSDPEGQTPRARGFSTLQDLWSRANVKRATIEKLASADAFRSLGLDRRQALWEVRGLVPAPALPLFQWRNARETGEEPRVALPEMALSEHVVNDYQTLRLSLKAHPMNFLRDEFRVARVLTCNEVRTLKDGARVSVAGVVLIRQRPGTAKGVVFMTLEDETGVANAVVWPKMLEKFRKVVMTARLIEIEGRVQRHEDIIHIIAERLIDRSDWLLKLSEWAGDMKAPLANADEVLHPDPGSARGSEAEANDPRHHPRFARTSKARHPRDVRIIPKSRDFH